MYFVKQPKTVSYSTFKVVVLQSFVKRDFQISDLRLQRAYVNRICRFVVLTFYIYLTYRLMINYEYSDNISDEEELACIEAYIGSDAFANCKHMVRKYLLDLRRSKRERRGQFGQASGKALRDFCFWTKGSTIQDRGL